MAWPLLSMIWVCGFAGILAIIGILQMVKMIDGEGVAPQRVWKWFVILSAAWPLFAFVLTLVGLLTLFFPDLTNMPQRTPKQPVMKTKKFAFTVKARDEKWDCYHFESSDGKPGTLGFTKRGAQWVIGLMCAGHLTEEAAKKKLEEADDKEG